MADRFSWVFVFIAIVLICVFWFLKQLFRKDATSHRSTRDEQAQRTPIVSPSARYLPRESPALRSSFTSRPSSSRRPRELGFGIDMNTISSPNSCTARYPPHPHSSAPYSPETSANSSVSTTPYPLIETMPQPATSEHFVSLYPLPNTLLQPATRSARVTAPYPLPHDIPHPRSSTIDQPPPSYTEVMNNR